jgi:hypothetical protein
MGAKRRVEALRISNFGSRISTAARRNRIQNSSAAATGMVISLCAMVSTVQLILNIILDFGSRYVSVNLFDIKD